MFNSKQTNLFTTTKTKETTSDSIPTASTMVVGTNQFVKEAYKAASTTLSGNGALKYSTTGSNFVDQFAKVTNFKTPRSFAAIAKDMELLWSQNPRLTLALTFYIRMITRTTHFGDGTKTTTVQRGQGLKHEGIFRMIWLAVEHPDVFWKNINLWIAIGSWKDIITMLQYDLVWHSWNKRVLNWEQFGKLILAGLENPHHSELLKKYLPQIKANSHCTTVESQADNIIAKWICSLIWTKAEVNKFAAYKGYRLLKTSGTAHQWQQLISQGKFLQIDFKTIHGRALAQLVSSKFLKNHGLEKVYSDWLETQPVAKFTGYPYELLGAVAEKFKPTLTEYQLDTIDKQFGTLVETAKKGMKTNTSLITVVDTSGSMTSTVSGTKVSSYAVAMSLAMYFSRLLTGHFANSWFEFNTICKFHLFKTGSPSRALLKETKSVIGGTNFLSVADKFIELKRSGVPESEFPCGILCLSDGEFNSGTRSRKTTNFKEFKMKLAQGGFSTQFVADFKIILWDIPNSYYGTNKPKFEDFADTPNLFHISGLDGSVVAFILGTDYNPTTPLNSDELFLAAMNQELLLKLEV